MSRGVEWAEQSWNPTTGCTKVSPGCVHCWAERMARRLHGMGQKRYANGFRVTTHEDLLETPLRWVKPRRTLDGREWPERPELPPAPGQLGRDGMQAASRCRLRPTPALPLSRR